MLLSATSWIWKITCFWFLSPPLPQYQILTWSPKPLQSLWRGSSVGSDEACPMLHMPLGKTVWRLMFTCSTYISNVFYRRDCMYMVTSPYYLVLLAFWLPVYVFSVDRLLHTTYKRMTQDIHGENWPCDLVNTITVYHMNQTLCLFELFQATSHAVSGHQWGHQPNVKSRRVRSELQVSYNNQYYFQAYHIISNNPK